MKALLYALIALTCINSPVLANMHQEDYLPGQQTLSQAGIAPEKAQKIRAIREQNQKAIEPLKTKAKTQRQALMDYMANPNANAQQAQTMSEQLHQTMIQMDNLKLQSWFDMRQHLTPEQMQKLVNARQQRLAAGREKMMHNRQQQKRPRQQGTQPNMVIPSGQWNMPSN
jgi:Spy/CpxP family protein refolding chaperone